MKKTFLFIADIHAGSAYALVPQGFPLSDGSLAAPNIGQKYLQQIYDQAVATCPPLDGIITVGDMVDGVNYKDYGKFLTEQDPTRQVKMAYSLMEPFIDKLMSGGRVYCLRGSKYHTGGDAFEEMLGQALGAEEDPFGYSTFAWLRLPVFRQGSVLLDVAHHQSYAPVNKVMPLEREIRDVFQKRGKLGYEPYEHTLIVRAHVHFGLRVLQEETVTAISLPSMKLQDPFAAGGKRPNATCPDSLGMVFVELSDAPPYVTYKPVLGIHPSFTAQVFV